MDVENSSKVLIEELNRLRKQLKRIKQEKEQLEITLDMITDHADLLETELVDNQNELEKRVLARDRSLNQLKQALDKERTSKIQLIEELIHLRQQLQTLANKKKTLEISLELITEHADAFEGQLLTSQETLEHKVAERTQELADNNRRLEAEIRERKRFEIELCQARDLAEQARMAAEIASRAKSIFLAKISHELRTPLNAIIGYSEMLKEDAQDIGIPDAAEDLLAIHTAGNHLLNIINDVLDISKIEAEKMELNPEEFSILDMIANLTDMFRPLLIGNELIVQCPESIGTLYADRTRAQQILQNLLSNAVRFTEHGEIRIIVERHPHWIQFAIEDTGIGIAPDKVKNIFDAFIQADDSYTRRYDGMGLGLTICKQLCKIMGGEISVRSELGQGSVFTVQLPVRNLANVQ